MDWTGFIIGILFGAALYLGGLADPDKIIGTLKFKDFHAFRTIFVFVIVGMLGVWILDAFGASNYSVKPTIWFSVLIGGGLLGIGFGLIGYCPGTGLACAATGRLDALVSVLGMFAGALVYILIYPSVAVPLENAANAGKVTLPEATGIPKFVWTICFAGIGAAAIILTFKAKKEPAFDGPESA